MKADALYQLLMAELLKRDAQILSDRFEEKHFGSFAITFVVDGAERTVVNDRGELALIEPQSERPLGETLFADFRDVDPHTIVDAVIGV